MNDRELLELAAKASGELTPSWYGNDAYFDGVLSRWNPLEDDGDALRLAVGLSLQIRQVHFAAHAGFPDTFWKTELHKDNPYAATRRAIVRAAAEIGKRMK